MSSSSAVNSTSFMNGDYGEFGYVAPEYGTNPIATAKGDVYVFGVVLMELAMGQKAAEVTIPIATAKGDVYVFGVVLMELAMGQKAAEVTIDVVGGGVQRQFSGLGESALGSRSDTGCHTIVQFLNIACGCVVARPKERPAMSQIYDSLKSIGEDHDSSEHLDEFPLIYGKDDPAVI